MKYNNIDCYKVSIIVPIYNVEKYIEECSISLFKQTYKNIEYIFVNDCTKDNSISILESTIKRFPEVINDVKIINHQYNRGLAAARNTGVKNARGKYILHVDSDDYLDINAIKLLIIEAQKSNADIVYSDVNIIKENGKRIKKNEIKCISKDEYLKLVIERKVLVNIWGKLLKAELYNSIDVFPNEGENFGEDYVTLPKLIYYSHKISYVNKSLYYYRFCRSGSYTSIFKKDKIKKIYDCGEELKKFFYKKNIQNFDELIDIYNKISVIENASMQDYNYINELYPKYESVSSRIIRDIPLKHKISLILFKKSHLSLYLYLKTGKLIEYALNYK